VKDIPAPHSAGIVTGGSSLAAVDAVTPQPRSLYGLALAVAFWSGCGSEAEARIVAERTRFRDLAPAEYVIAACGTGAEHGCTREVVIAGRVVTAELADAAEAPWRPVPEVGTWVDQVSSMFEAVLHDAGSLRLLEFEPRWHYVSEYHLGGDEGGRKVTCFLPHRVDLQQCRPGEAALGAE
jgi:hypothetical protein